MDMKLCHIMHVFQNGSGVHPTSYPVGNGGVRQQEREANNSSPSNAAIKEIGTAPPLHNLF
jgi:hypothetical protein